MCPALGLAYPARPHLGHPDDDQIQIFVRLISKFILFYYLQVANLDSYSNIQVYIVLLP